MLIDLKNKVVCVTGSARRVGRAVALEFARQGVNLVIHHSSSDAAAESAALEAKTLGVDAMIVKADQANPDDVEKMFEAIRAHYGRLDVLVNSAASFKKGNFVHISFDEWQSVLGTNLTGPFLCTQRAARLMIEGKRGGTVINISDNSGLQPWQARPHHSITKAGVIMLTQVAALSLAEYNIRVNCVVPGPVLAAADEPEDSVMEVARGLPLQRIGEPSDIARGLRILG